MRARPIAPPATAVRAVTFIVAVAMAVGTGAACNRRPSYQSPGPVKAEVEYKMDAAAFDLETVVGLLKTKQVKDADELQAKINAPASGINNVDLDGDKMVDFVAVKEERNGDNNRQLNFLAFPSSKNGADPTPIASVSFTVGEDRKQMNVVGGYPSYVNGYGSSSYVFSVPYEGPSFGEMVFLSWLFSPRPVYVYAPYATYGYRPYAIGAPELVTTRRTTYRTETRVAPIERQAPPPGSSPRFATQADSRWRRPAPSASPAPSPGLSSSGRSAQDFHARNATAPKPTATGFGAPARPATASSSPPPAASPPSASAPRPSSSSSSSGWGARPSAPSSSWGSGSSRSSSSSGSFGGRTSSFSSRRR